MLIKHAGKKTPKHEKSLPKQKRRHGTSRPRYPLNCGNGLPPLFGAAAYYTSCSWGAGVAVAAESVVQFLDATTLLPTIIMTPPGIAMRVQSIC
jgi:hypothetical protein